jgi:hypothetical protein
LVADGNNVYAWDPVLKTKTSVVLTSFVSIQYIAVDKKGKRVFVVDYNPASAGKKYSVFSNNVTINNKNKT